MSLVNSVFKGWLVLVISITLMFVLPWSALKGLLLSLQDGWTVCVSFHVLELFNEVYDYSFKFCVSGLSRLFSLENISIRIVPLERELYCLSDCLYFHNETGHGLLLLVVCFVWDSRLSLFSRSLEDLLFSKLGWFQVRFEEFIGQYLK